MTINLDVTLTGLAAINATLREMAPQFRNSVYGPALGAMSKVVRGRARTRNLGFTDGRGVRPFDAAEGRTRSVRLRSTIRTRRIAAFYGSRRFKLGRASVTVGAAGARHGYLVEAGHGGPRPARPHPFLTRALMESQAEQFAAFTAEVRARFRPAVERARQKALSRLAGIGRSRGATAGRTASRSRRGR